MKRTSAVNALDFRDITTVGEDITEVPTEVDIMDMGDDLAEDLTVGIEEILLAEMGE